MKTLRPLSMLATAVCTLCGPIAAMGQMSDTVLNRTLTRGRDLFHADVGCWVCHSETGEGLVGPTLHFGPTPLDIWDQLQSNPIMGVIVTELDPTNEDLIAVAMYVRTLAGLPEDRTLPDQWRADLEALQASQGIEPEFPKTERDLQIEAIERFDSLQSTWTRRATEGNVLSQYESRIVRTWDPGEPQFEPQPGKTYFYQNVGTASSPTVLFDGYRPLKGNQLVVGDAETLEVIASYEMPENLRASVHTTVMSPDGKYAYMTGPREPGPDGSPMPLGSWTILKIDAITLQPVAQIAVGARLHHGQVFGDLVMFDWFQRDPDQRMGVSFYDPRTDTVVGGIQDVEMGGYFYNVWTDRDYEYIYAMMEPAGYAPGRNTGMEGVRLMYSGHLLAMRPFWIAKIDPRTWEVIAEFPLPGYRPNWAVVDASKEYIYPVMTNSTAAKMDLATGEVIWTSGTGIAPYGGSLNADETELWIADKGEGAHQMGRTVTVIDIAAGRVSNTLYGAYKTDHVLLAPNGREMWGSSNGEGRLYVYDAERKELIKKIDMPGNGDAHGLVWVHYDEDGNSRVVRDQGNFHGGINPAGGIVLDY